MSVRLSTVHIRIISQVADLNAQSVGNSAKKRKADVDRAFFDLDNMGVSGADYERKAAHGKILRHAKFSDALPEKSLSIRRVHYQYSL